MSLTATRRTPILLALLVAAVLGLLPTATVRADDPPVESDRGTVTGRVVGSDGKPIATPSVAFVPGEHEGSWGGLTEPDGSFSFEMPAGTYRLYANGGTSHREGWANGATSFETATTVTVVAGQVVRDVIVTIAPRPQYDMCDPDGTFVAGTDGPRPDGYYPGCPPRVGMWPWQMVAVIYVTQGCAAPVPVPLELAGFTRETLCAAGLYLIEHPDGSYGSPSTPGGHGEGRDMLLSMVPPELLARTPATLPDVVLGLPGAVSPRGAFAIPVTCTDSACKGTVAVTTRVRTAAPRHGRAPRTRVVTIAKGRVREASSARLRLRLNATGRRLLRTSRKLSISVTWTTPGAASTSTRRTLALRRR
ncbi:carboxypeptidase regulatory-like domain-containing protein [Patulibacter defluvii]|uniref:carboxypeptidase regulatory-like domain-containing protein n=1 Tax=Patulibacter defluvii TaxID=3095358 RepID=UPI002A7663D6|nr:carboxypeptidase regulatory-like domain-containing protein [Patulibacter sp. DM4]